MGMRFAGNLLKKLGPNFAKAFPKEIDGKALPGRGILGSVLPDVGFGVMSTSDFVPTATFGALVASTLAIGTVVNLTLLPAFVVWASPAE